jgi:hypothetical protein
MAILVHVVAILYIIPILVYYIKKSLATLAGSNHFDLKFSFFFKKLLQMVALVGTYTMGSVPSLQNFYLTSRLPNVLQTPISHLQAET